MAHSPQRNTASRSKTKNTKRPSGKHRLLNWFLGALVIAGAVSFVVRFGTPQLLRWYVKSGIGDCEQIPILCMAPRETISEPAIDQAYRDGLLKYEFPRIIISIPEGTVAIQERIKKVYYYRRLKRPQPGTVFYLLHQEPRYFVNLFPKLTRQCILDDYEFIRRTMHAKLNRIQNIIDTFFVIMKGIFVPDLGNQNDVIMAEFNLDDKHGFINYNLNPSGNFFDCNIFDKKGNYFKVYIKDKAATLDLPKVFTIISTVRENNTP